MEMDVWKDSRPDGECGCSFEFLRSGNHPLAATAKEKFRTKCFGQHLRQPTNSFSMVCREENTGQIDGSSPQLRANTRGHL